MATSDGELDMLRERMRELRGRIALESADVAAGARRIVDWRHHFRKMPWLALGGAAVVGFLAVPKKKPATTEADRQNLAKIEALLAAIDPAALPKRREASLASALWTSVGNAVVKAGASFVANHIAAALAPRTPAKHHEQSPPPASPKQPR